jgi:hypothetical protein
LVSAAGSPGETYVKLPNFLKVAGTLGNPKAQIDKTALAGTLLEQFGSKIPGLNDKTGGLLQGLGGILSKGQTTSTNQTPPSGANATPATNKPPAFNPFDLLKKPKQ